MLGLSRLRMPIEQLKRRPSDTPDKDWFMGLKEFMEFTPDIAILKQKECHFLFVYDNCMRGRPAYDKIKDASVFRCHGFTENTFHMWRKKLGSESFPIALEKNDPNDRTPWKDENKFLNRFEQNARIKGEIHLVQTNQFIKLDKDYLNGVEFDRKKVTIEIPWTVKRSFEGVVKTLNRVKTIDIWMYVGNPDYWYGLTNPWSCYAGKREQWDTIDNGYLFDPVNIYNGRSKWPPYYYYSLMEGQSD